MFLLSGANVESQATDVTGASVLDFDDDFFGTSSAAPTPPGIDLSAFENEIFQLLFDGGGDVRGTFDSFVVTPEPSTALLTILGLATLAAHSSRRRKRVM